MVGKSVLKLSKTDVVRSHGHLSSALPPAVGVEVLRHEVLAAADNRTL